MQRPEAVTTRDGGLGVSGCVARSVCIDGHERAQARLQSLGSPQYVLDHLDWRQPTRADGFKEVGRGEIVERRHTALLFHGGD